MSRIGWFLLVLAIGAGVDGPCARSFAGPASQSLPRRIYGAPDERYPYYAGLPEELWPYRNIQPYQRYFITRLPFLGPGRDYPPPSQLKALKIGLLSPSPNGPDWAGGRRMQEGVALAIEEANAERRPGQLPFQLIAEDVPPQWGGAGSTAIDLADQGVLGILGTFDGTATHVALRVILKLETVLVNTADADPTLTQTLIPWLLRILPDQRQEEARLAELIVKGRGCRRVAIMRENDYFGRLGVMYFADFVRRLGRPPVQHLLFNPGQRDVRHQIAAIKSANPDAVFFVGPPDDIGRFARQFRQARIRAQFFGLDRLMDDSFRRNAGDAAEGTTITYFYDPANQDPLWVRFVARFEKRWSHPPDAYAAYGYDGAQLLIDAIQRAGPNRWRVRDQLLSLDFYHGVTGWMRFDGSWNNIAPVRLTQFRHGRWQFLPQPAFSPFVGEASRK